MSPKKTLTELGRKPRGVSVVNVAWRYLVGTHHTVSDLFKIVEELRATKAGDGRGRLDAKHQDLLRAAIVFTSSGVDTCCQRLVLDVLNNSTIVDVDSIAGKSFQQYVSARLEQRPPDEVRRAILDPMPRAALITLYAKHLTRSSLQGSGDLARVGCALGIPEVWFDGRKGYLDGFFMSRNRIVHQMDYEDPREGSFVRVMRGPVDVRNDCDYVLTMLRDLIREAAARVKQAEGQTVRPR